MDRANNCAVDALVMIEDAALREPGLGWGLQQLFGFTEAEAHLAVRLLYGLTPEQAEDARGFRCRPCAARLKAC